MGIKITGFDFMKKINTEDDIDEIIVPDGVRFIAARAFANTSVKSVVLPDSVTVIGHEAFYGCHRLVNVRLPQGLTTLYKGTFEECTALQTIYLPDSLTSIGDATFRNCTSLEGIIIPDRVQKLCFQLFFGCSRLKWVVLPDNLTCIASGAFLGCTEISSFTYSGERMVDLSPVNGIEHTKWYQGHGGGYIMLGSLLLRYKGKEESIVVPGDVRNIATYAFKECSGIREVTIPSNVDSVGGAVFQRINTLESVWIDARVIGSSAFRSCKNLKTVTFGSNVKEVQHHAFWECDSLEYIHAAASVEKVQDPAFAQNSSVCIELMHSSTDELPYSLITGRNITMLMLPNCTPDVLIKYAWGTDPIVAALKGFIKMLEGGRQLDEQIVQRWTECASEYAMVLIEKTEFDSQVISFLCSRRMLTLKQTELCIGHDLNVVTMAQLLAYKQSFDNDDTSYSLD